jgi:hypothetical protein
MFNVVMLIFPEGKTQKFCKLTIKIFLLIYIMNNAFFSGSIDLGEYIDDMPSYKASYEREISIRNMDVEFIEKINADMFGGEEVIREITVLFGEDSKINTEVALNKLLNIDETKKLKSRIAEIFKISEENIMIDL